MEEMTYQYGRTTIIRKCGGRNWIEYLVPMSHCANRRWLICVLKARIRMPIRDRWRLEKTTSRFSKPLFWVFWYVRWHRPAFCCEYLQDCCSMSFSCIGETIEDVMVPLFILSPSQNLCGLKNQTTRRVSRVQNTSTQPHELQDPALITLPKLAFWWCEWRRRKRQFRIRTNRLGHSYWQCDRSKRRHLRAIGAYVPYPF